jgi:hypothetical protein
MIYIWFVKLKWQTLGQGMVVVKLKYDRAPETWR